MLINFRNRSRNRSQFPQSFPFVILIFLDANFFNYYFINISLNLRNYYIFTNFVCIKCIVLLK